MNLAKGQCAGNYTNNGHVGPVKRVQGSELHIVGGFTLSTSKGHILGATLQGFPWKQGLKSKVAKGKSGVRKTLIFTC